MEVVFDEIVISQPTGSYRKIHKFMTRAFLMVLLLSAGTAGAALNITVSPAKMIGQKADVQLGLQNNLNENVRSARAVVFLLDDQGKVVAQGSRWIIGGFVSSPGLAAGATNTFHFVVDAAKPFTGANVTAKVTVNRVVLEGGRLADVNKDVQVKPAAK
jgi:hypothetical protein